MSEFLDREYIYDLYIEKNYSINTIQEITGLSKSLISKSIHHYNIVKTKENKYKARTLVTKKRNLEKYGDENYNNIEKHKATIKEKYSVSNISQIDAVKEKKKITCKEHFGVDFPSQSNNWKEKINLYYQNKYGCDWSTQRKDFWDIIDIDKWLHNQYITKRKNNTFKKSFLEDKLYEELKISFEGKTILRQYKEERYPFYCDFYIVEDDLFIELNAHWTHGGKPYNPNDDECQKQLAIWQEKAKTSQFFQNAIQTWTVRDVEKQKVAKENNLNYKVIY